jgi:hypothetical protein
LGLVLVTSNFYWDRIRACGFYFITIKSLVFRIFKTFLLRERTGSIFYMTYEKNKYIVYAKQGSYVYIKSRLI